MSVFLEGSKGAPPIGAVAPPIGAVAPPIGAVSVFSDAKSRWLFRTTDLLTLWPASSRRRAGDG